jgi:hypothetical protein
VGGALGICGLLAIASVFSIDGYTWGVLGHVSTQAGVDQHSLEAALHEVQQSGWSLVYYLPVLLFPAGMAILAIAASRYAGVPPVAAIVAAVGALMVGLEGAISSNAYFIASSIVWLAGSALLAVAIARMSDAQFAGPIPEP